MKEIKAKTSNRNYNILIKRNITDDFNDILNNFFSFAKKVFFLTNEKIFMLHGEKFIKKMKNNFHLEYFLLRDGEEYKNLDTLSEIYDFFLKNNAHRDDLVIAFGGGVIGDTVGMAAATFNRGITLVHYPTTIISQVDSSIGGKVAVNFQCVKNIIGCFYQPHLVVTDPSLLQTLEEKEIINGLAEIIKYGLVFDYSIIEEIRKIIGMDYKKDERLKKLISDERFDDIIAQCSKIKADIVEKDEFDKGTRNLLNFGHTIGHALEKVLGFKFINHGQAVALGMLCMIDISISLGFFDKSFKNEMIDIYKLLKLPTKIKKTHIDEIMKVMKYDKKITKDTLKFIILKKLNLAIPCDDIDETIVKDSINKNMG